MEENMDDVSCDHKESVATQHNSPGIMLLMASMQLLIRIGGHGNGASKSFNARIRKRRTWCSRQPSSRHPKFL